MPRIRFHDLRHTCATHLLLSGINVKAVAARLGHSSPVVTLNTYAHFLPEMEDRAIAVLAAFAAPVGPGPTVDPLLTGAATASPPPSATPVQPGGGPDTAADAVAPPVKKARKPRSDGPRG